MYGRVWTPTRDVAKKLVNLEPLLWFALLALTWFLSKLYVGSLSIVSIDSELDSLMIPVVCT